MAEYAVEEDGFLLIYDREVVTKVATVMAVSAGQRVGTTATIEVIPDEEAAKAKVIEQNGNDEVWLAAFPPPELDDEL